MSKFEWTVPQSHAIKAEGDILVSAAAGSGKTAVLVARVMRLIENGCNVDEMLIVTFTRAAAAQMKEKIAAAIEERLEKEPENRHFKLQQILLEKASISTIDSFCADVLKNHFQHLENIDISMNYKNLDAAQFGVLSREVTEEVLEEFYLSESPSFRALMDVCTGGKNDTNIYNIIDVLHQYTSAFAEPDKWMQHALALYEEGRIAHSPWGEVMFESMSDTLSLALSYSDRALAIVGEDEATDAVYGAFLREERVLLAKALEAVKQKDWATLVSLKNTTFSPYPRSKKGIDESLRELAKGYRDEAKNLFGSALKNVIETEEEFREDNAAIYPVAAELKKVYEAYEKRLFERKLERQEFEFSDIAFLALKILLTDDGVPTQAALEYRRRFKAVLVDEYQDTNGVQDLIFQTISDNNLFVVGDVKQSIYRFRQAMPEIFIDRKKALEPYEEGKKNGYILLSNNFRSEKPITDFVNFLFKNLMSESLGDVDYHQDEYLIPGNPSKTLMPAPELHVLNDAHLPDREKVKKADYEARYIAELIRARVAGGEMLKIGESERQTQYSDYCVLVRSKTHMPELMQAFEKIGVPYSCTGGDSLFDAPEIMLVMSFLRAIDNPLRDVDLIAVMYSEIFGFSADELALIRLAKRRGSFFAAVSEFATGGNEKCARFLQVFEEYRMAAATNPPAEFLRIFYQKSALPAIVSAGENGEVKQANLMKFISTVSLYSDAGYFGLTGLVRFLEKVKQNGSDIGEAYVPEGESKVKIMTVHASKGLEFPIVILAFTNSSNTHTAANLVLSREYGIGMKPKNLRENAVYDTLAFAAINRANQRAEMAEELRVLYVALTRAANQLVVTGTFDGAQTADTGAPRNDKIAEIAYYIGAHERIPEGWLRQKNNYLYWILACALRHPDGTALRALYPEGEYTIEHNVPGALKIVLPTYYPEAPAEEEQAFYAAADAALKEKILENFSFRYRFEGSERIDSKKTPSAVAEHANRADEGFEKPAFLLEEGMDAAAKGTATHRFMEKVSTFRSPLVAAEVARMVKKGFLSEAQAQVLDVAALERFFASDLCRRMAASERLEKEYPAAYLEVASFFDDTLPAAVRDEKVFVDGMLDAVFIENGEAVIVDYKTDKVHSGAELTERYGKQMVLYKRAIEAVWNIPVKECCIYSFALGETVRMDMRE